MIVFGCGGHGSSVSPYSVSISRAYHLNLGALEYANDYDDCMALPGKWMDCLAPYEKTASDYYSPAVQSHGYGFALNNQVAGVSFATFSDPSTTVSIFDSTDLSRNATDPTSTMPNPPRYGTKNTIAYLDGHVQDYTLTQTPPNVYQISRGRLKACDLGMIMYANDYDDVLPLANKWMDELDPYLRSETDYHSPKIGDTGSKYGYAFDITVAGKNLVNIPNPATQLMLFDSTDLARNATAPESTIPSPPRYGKSNTLAYADGHVGQ